MKSISCALFKTASILTDPICKSHEYYWRMSLVEALSPKAFAISKLARKIILFLGVLFCGFLGIVTTIPGIGLRWAASSIQAQPYIFTKGEGKNLPDSRTFSLLSWNICSVAGGYSISDGGVLPWSFRVDEIIHKVVEKDADVNCLYETFDTSSAFYISEKLKSHGYSHCYFNIGPKAVGVSSGILVASKYALYNPEFTPFPLDSLIGRTKNAAKGVFGFDLESRGQLFARIYTTHLQHSEEPEFPTDEEREARRKQMHMIVDKVNAIKDRCVVVTGDLNLDDAEYSTSTWKDLFQKGDHFEGRKTWGGDAFCARLVGKRISGPLNLDHTAVVKGRGAIHTTLVETGYDAFQFKSEALSDHAGLLTQLVLYPPLDA